MIRVKEGFDRRVGGTVSLRFGGERVKFGMLFGCEGLLPRLFGDGTPEFGVGLVKEAFRIYWDLEFESVVPPDVLGRMGRFVEFLLLLLPPNKVP